MSLRLVTAAFACGLASLLFSAPAEAGGVYVRSGNVCGARYYSTCAPRRTVVVNRNCYARPPVVYSSGRCATVVTRPVSSCGTTYYVNRRAYSYGNLQTANAVVVRRPNVVYTSRRGYNRSGDRYYISRQRHGNVKVKIDFD